MNDNMLMPQKYMTHISFDKSYRDDVLFFWFSKIQGKYKSKNLVKRLKKINKL